ncbi:MAG: hypothetical protein HYZ53_07755 [Planctomycetes bacterium]|nr:hypothetical protein [Planctomycetota bacterium]
MVKRKRYAWLVVLLSLSLPVAWGQDLTIKEGNAKRGNALAHAPGSWLSMTGASYVSGAFTWNADKKKYDIRDDVSLDNLPSAVKLDLAMARERAKTSGHPRTWGSLKEEIEASINAPDSRSKFLLNNQYISSERRDIYKNVHDTEEFGWWGHCNGEAGASIYEKVPKEDVNIHGIKFSPNDWKELYTLSYSGDFPTEFAGSRSNISSGVYDRAKELLKKPDDANFLPEMKKLYKEAFYVDAPPSWEAKHYKSLFDKQVKAFEDMPPAEFHRMLTSNIDKGTGLVFDRSPGNVVWNYPASGYESDLKKDGTKVVDGKTVDVYHATTKVTWGDYSDYSWSGGGGYSYDLYADPATGKVVGGEWTGDSVRDHPDFAWKPTKSLKDLEKDKTRQAEKRKMLKNSGAIRKYLGDDFKRRGWNDLAARLDDQDYMYVMSELKTKKEDQLLQYVNYLENLGNDLTYRNVYTGARMLHDKYAPDAPAAPIPTAAPTGPGAAERLNEAAGSGTPGR